MEFSEFKSLTNLLILKTKEDKLKWDFINKENTYKTNIDGNIIGIGKRHITTEHKTDGTISKEPFTAYLMVIISLDKEQDLNVMAKSYEKNDSFTYLEQLFNEVDSRYNTNKVTIYNIISALNKL